MRSINPGCPNFLDKKDHRFASLHKTLDSLFNKLHADGIGRNSKKTEILTVEDEKLLWESGVLNTSTPRGLLNAAFYTVGKMFCLRGGQEHRFLKLSQIRRTDDKYVYSENVSKNRNGSFKQLHVQNKVVPLYPNPDIGEHCPVFILDKYISKLPKKLVEQDIFYARPLENVPSTEDAPWYAPVPLGKHTLQSMVKKMCEDAKIKGSKSNHSLRATAATQMFQEGAPEKVIQERTGHRSLEGLRSYERSCESQHRALSNLLSSNATERKKDTPQQITHSKVLALTSTQMNKTLTENGSIIPSMNFKDCTVNVTINQGSSSSSSTEAHHMRNMLSCSATPYNWSPYMYSPIPECPPYMYSTSSTPYMQSSSSYSLPPGLENMDLTYEKENACPDS